MSDQWREILYFIGFFSSLAFGLRMAFQWLYSEYLGKSVVTPTFWRLSLCGNALLALHAFIQLQFHVFIIQIGNGIISWRNLNLMQNKHKPLKTVQVIALMTIALIAATAAFAAQALLTTTENASDTSTWFRIPVTPWGSSRAQTVSWVWHLLGTTGIILFNSRFWIQWWGAEKSHQSGLSNTFWWISLSGEILCLGYFMKIGDAVNFIGPLFALIPYVRNLMLIYKGRRQPVTE